MQKRELSPFLAKNNENSIPEIPNLGNVEQPQKIGKGRIILVVTNTGSNGVVVAVSQEDSLDCHVGAKHNLGHVVHKFDGVGVNRRDAGFHDCRSNDDKQKIGRCNFEGKGEIRHCPSLQVKCIRVDDNDDPRWPSNNLSHLGVALVLPSGVGPLNDGVPDGVQSIVIRVHDEECNCRILNLTMTLGQKGGRISAIVLGR